MVEQASLFDHLRDEEEVVLGGRRIADDLVGIAAIGLSFEARAALVSNEKGRAARRDPDHLVMPGLEPGIHALSRRGADVDGRDKPGHDTGEEDRLAPPPALTIVLLCACLFPS